MRTELDEAIFKLRVVVFCVLILCIISVLFVYLRFEQKQKASEDAIFAMNTCVQQTVYGKNSDEVVRKVSNDVTALETSLSLTTKSSDIIKINNHTGQDWIDISERTTHILSVSQDISRKSMGVFDPTIFPVSSLWGFSPPNHVRQVPDPNELKQALKKVNCENLRINPEVQRVKKFDDNLKLDLTFAQKGAACDQALETYYKNKQKAGIISVGSSVGAFGKNPNNPNYWRVAINNPLFDKKSSDRNLGIFQLKNGCISTLTYYENFFDERGKTYCSVLNPKTGYPVDSDLVSVTVTNKSGLISNILSYTCFLLDRESSKYLLDYYDAGAVFVYRGYKVYVTDNIKDDMVILNQDFTLIDEI